MSDRDERDRGTYRDRSHSPTGRDRRERRHEGRDEDLETSRSKKRVRSRSRSRSPDRRRSPKRSRSSGAPKAPTTRRAPDPERSKKAKEAAAKRKEREAALLAAHEDLKFFRTVWNEANPEEAEPGEAVGSIPTQSQAQDPAAAVGGGGGTTSTSTAASGTGGGGGGRPNPDPSLLRPGDPGYNPEAEAAVGSVGAAGDGLDIRVDTAEASRSQPPARSTPGRFPQGLHGASQFRAGILERYRGAMAGGEGGDGQSGLKQLVAPRTQRKRVYAPYRPKPQMTSQQRDDNDALLGARPQLRF